MNDMKLPRLHTREIIVQRARIDLLGMLIKLEKEWDLTIGEMIMLLNEEAVKYASYQIRQERHGDTSKPGGLVDESSEEKTVGASEASEESDG